LQVTAEMLENCRNTFSADGAHMEGVGPQSFGTLCNTVSYDANRNLNVSAYHHNAATESTEVWDKVTSGYMSTYENISWYIGVSECI
jgi:hypothetical protein